ncbi:MAG: DNA-directed RNA polymerase subunit beta' [Patescibacteria group bacterium]|nr:DNA-directed RNA polymerase subunit beta' [Patescibacteria group bacterium]
MIPEAKNLNFKAIRLKLASPEEILGWSHGEVTRPETINYRTQKPEKDGLFCERIFGPTKDWQCYCGKYKKIRYKGIVCDKCGVEVTRSIVRRERMGHIKLAAPTSHIWFLRGVPSKIGLVLNLSIQNLEKVVYFANFIITSVDENAREETLEQIDKEYQGKLKKIEEEFKRRRQKIKQTNNEEITKTDDEEKKKQLEEKTSEELKANAEAKKEELRSLEETVDLAKKELKELEPKLIISENKYQDLSIKYGHVFEAGIGAEALQKLLKEIDLDKLIKELEDEFEGAAKNKKKKISRRLRLFKNLKENNIKPEWMILTVVPIIPPDLRPMVQLDGGRFATSDLNDLYRRVINRNNRLKKLIELNAPEVIRRNEKRMLQEAVDALIDNGARKGKTVTASTGQKRTLKSIADVLKGKQGRFRQNLLGKRVDYSGRSVIVIGPHLKLNQCGIPKHMALELFRPFVISQLIKREYVHNVRSAGRFIEADRPEVWDILEEVIKDAYVLLNRAPTLHRLGIQAFQPILIEGKAIQIHPLVCAAFNADFDGDQMAVHLPLTEQAKKEAKNIMLSTNNLLKPATGSPVTTPSQDIVLGCYYLTIKKKAKKKINHYSSKEEALLAYEIDKIHFHETIKVLINTKLVETTVGRVIFNSILPKKLQYINEVMNKKKLSNLISEAISILGREKTVVLLDNIKEFSFEYLTRSGISWGMDDLVEAEKKQELIEEAEDKVKGIEEHYKAGLLTDRERQIKVIENWAKTKENIQEVCKESLDKFGPVYAMIESGSRGSWGQITQMMGMKGLVTNPAGETIELPVKGNFKVGFDVLEYFISTHGARKGLSDTALRTANAGYLTRRLIDVAQEIVVNEKDCKDKEGLIITKEEAEEMGGNLSERALGRYLLKDVKNPKTKKVVVKKNTLINEKEAEKIKKADPEKIHIRSLLTCKAQRGVCQKCYGYDLSYNKLVEIGTAVGIIAAQSIGEPGTQLTMRTFHTGGVAGQDITQGLPRVEELFEARHVKKAAVISEVKGVAHITEEGDNKIIKIDYTEEKEEVLLKKRKKIDKDNLKVKDGDKVKVKDLIYEKNKKKIKSSHDGVIKIEDDKKIILQYEEDSVKEYVPPVGHGLWIKEGDLVTPGQQLTEGSLDLKDYYRLSGSEAAQKYIMKEIQYIYSSQGQKLNNKHVEVIVKQMFSRVLVRDPGDTERLIGEVTDLNIVRKENEKAEKENKQPAKVKPLLLGITKASLSTESFLSAASFQETARVLIDAAITGKVDKLRGLKENVIIGKLIPAGTGYRKT